MPALVRATSSIRPVPRSLRHITRLDEESGFGLDLAPTLFGHSFSRPPAANQSQSRPRAYPSPLPLFLPLYHPGGVDDDDVVGAAICHPNNLRPWIAALATIVKGLCVWT